MSDTSSSGTSTKVSVGSSSTTVLAANVRRRYAIFVNDSNEEMYLSTSGTAVINTGVRINANGGHYEMLKGQNLVTGIITAICSSGTKNLSIEYW